MILDIHTNFCGIFRVFFDILLWGVDRIGCKICKFEEEEEEKEIARYYYI